jgi:hypothetical protein
MNATYTATYPIKQETITASFVPECIRCQHKTVLCIYMPYGTDWAGNFICPDCLHELVDPAITQAVEARKKKDEPRLFE